MTASHVVATPAKNALAAIVLLGFVSAIQTIDPIISSVALVEASKALHFSADITALASGISTLALAATVITSGLIADRIGRRRLLMIALAISLVGDLLVAFSTNAPVYLLGRVVAGVGLGGVFGASFAYVRAVAADHIGSALGQFGAVAGIVTMVGSLVGGTLVTTDWRLAYLVVPVLCLVGLILVPLILPKLAPLKAGPIDFPGVILIATGVIGILYGVSQASSSLTAITTWLPVVIGIAALGAFVWVEAKTKHPVFPIELLKSPVFIAAAVTVLIWNFSQAVTVLQLSNLWQYIEHYTPTMVTFGQLPLSLVAIVASILVGKNLASGKTPRSRILLGFGFIALGFLSFAIVPQGISYWVYLPGLIMIGFGIPYASVPSSQLFMSQAPAAFFGPVTSSKTTVGQFGYSLGLAGSMVLVNGLTMGGITHRLITAGVPPSQTGQGLDAVTMYVNTGVHANTHVGQQALQVAAASYSTAFSTAMVVAAILAAIAGVTTYVLLQRTPGSK